MTVFDSRTDSMLVLHATVVRCCFVHVFMFLFFSFCCYHYSCWTKIIIKLLLFITPQWQPTYSSTNIQNETQNIKNIKQYKEENSDINYISLSGKREAIDLRSQLTINHIMGIRFTQKFVTLSDLERSQRVPLLSLPFLLIYTHLCYFCLFRRPVVMNVMPSWKPFECYSIYYIVILCYYSCLLYTSDAADE